MVGERPELGRVQHDLVAEALQVLADRHEVHLGAARREQVAIGEHEAHAGQARAARRASRSTVRTIARQSVVEVQPEPPQRAVVDVEAPDVAGPRRAVADAGDAAGLAEHVRGQLADADADAGGAGQRRRARLLVLHRDEVRADGVEHRRERARLRAVAVDRQRRAGERAADEDRHDAAGVRAVLARADDVVVAQDRVVEARSGRRPTRQYDSPASLLTP